MKIKNNILNNLTIENQEEINKMFYSLKLKNLKNKLGENWKEQLDLIDDLRSNENIFLTIVDQETDLVGTFGEDNKFSIPSFILEALNRQKKSKLKLIILVRYFKDQYIDKIQLKDVSGCIINKDGVGMLTKEMVEDNSTIDSNTGKRIPKEKNVSYLGFKEFLIEHVYCEKVNKVSH